MDPPPRPRYRCDICGSEYDYPSQLEMHQRSHSDERPYPCPREGCEKRFKRRGTLDAHLKSSEHDNVREHYCHICFHAVGARDKLEEHLLSHVKRYCNVHTEQSRETLLKCERCKEVFPKFVSLVEHQQRLYKYPSYTCDWNESFNHCGQKYFNSFELQMHHMCKHEGFELCDICGFELNSKSELHEHKISVHGCSFCSYSNKNAEICGQYYLTPEELTAHDTSEHPRCDKCGSKLDNHEDLQEHLEEGHVVIN